LSVVTREAMCDTCGATMESVAASGVCRVTQLGVGNVIQLDWQPPMTASDISVTATDLCLSAASNDRGTKNNMNTVAIDSI